MRASPAFVATLFRPVFKFQGLGTSLNAYLEVTQAQHSPAHSQR
jgi:hypothetical protein